MGYDIYVEGQIMTLRDVGSLMERLKDASKEVRYFYMLAFGNVAPEVGEFVTELRASPGWGDEVAAFLAPHVDGVIKMYGEDNIDWKFVIANGDFEMVYREDL